MGFLTDFTDDIGLTDSKAGERAAQAQREAAELSNATLQKMYQDAQNRYSGYSDVGNNALGDYESFSRNAENFSRVDNPLRDHSGVFTMQDFKQDPGYQFRLQEGQKAIQRAGAAGGSLGSGASLKALSRFGQNTASQEYGNAYNRFNQDYGNAYNRFNADRDSQINRFGNLVNIGQNANAAITSAGTNSATGIANNQMSVGNANAAMEMGRNDATKSLWNMGMQGLGVAGGLGWRPFADSGSAAPSSSPGAQTSGSGKAGSNFMTSGA